MLCYVHILSSSNKTVQTQKDKGEEKWQDKSGNSQSWSVQGAASKDAKASGDALILQSTKAALRAGAECMSPHCSPQGTPQKRPDHCKFPEE